MKICKKLLLLFILTTGLSQAAQEHTQATLLESIQRAKIIEREAPKYPRLAAKNGREGWVQMSFVVDKQGRVKDPIIEDSSGYKEFEKKALKAVADWRYQPALKNGKPIEQCQNRVQMDFRLSKTPQGVRKKFRSLYLKASDHLTAGDIVNAQRVFNELTKKHQANMYESAWYWMLAANIAKENGDEKQQLKALRRAVWNDEALDYVGEQNYLNMMRRLFGFEAEQAQYKAALNTFASIEKSDKQGSTAQALQPYADQIAAILSGSKSFYVPANIENGEKWHHRLARNAFSFDYPAGQLSKVEVRCDNKREIYSIAPNTEWQIPQSWGQCSIFVDGKDGTEFKLIELPDEA